MPTISIDNKTVTVPAGATILDAAQLLGVRIPTLCFLKGLEPCTSCFVCVVKVEGREAFVPACATVAVDGMVVHSESPDVHAARRAAMELLLSEHAGDCMAPCQCACPAGMDIPRMSRLLAAGRMAEALHVIKSRIALPAVLGRVCPAPCEKACRRGKIDRPVAICLLKRLAADADLAGEPWRPAAAPTGKRIVIVGGGPAGLSAAWFALKMGHACTLVEAGPRAGGGLRHVEASRLGQEVLDREVAVLTAMGLQTLPGRSVTTADELAALRADADAVLLACGKITQEHAAAMGLAWAGHGLKIDQYHRTSQEGVFAAGAAAGVGARMAVRSGADALAAVEAMDAWMNAKDGTRDSGPACRQAGSGFGIRAEDAAPHSRRPWTCHLGAASADELARMMAACEAEHEDRGRDARDTTERGQDALETHGRDAHATADRGRDARDTAHATVKEARRCLHCDCRKAGEHYDDSAWPCRLRKWANEYGADAHRHGGQRREFVQDASNELVIYESGKCISCGLCIQIARAHGEELGLTFVGRGFALRVAVPFGGTMSQGLRKCAAEVAAACPVGAITLRCEVS